MVMAPTPALPQDADGLLKLAAQSMFDLYAQTVQGMMVVDREHRIVWISEGYKRFLPALGFEAETDFVGKMVEEVVPNTLMAQVMSRSASPSRACILLRSKKARSRSATPSRRPLTLSVAMPRVAITPRHTCCMPRCVRRSAHMCARRARLWPRTACVSTLRTTLR